MTVAPREPEEGPPKGYRPHMPMAVKIEAALLALGLDPKTVEWDHDPALQLRRWDKKKKDTIPPANDPRFIKPRPKAAHAEKSNGPATKAFAQGDKTEIAKGDRLAAQQAEFRRRILSKEPGKPREKTGSIKSAGFPKKPKADKLPCCERKRR